MDNCNNFTSLNNTELQGIIGGKHGLGYHIVDAVVSFIEDIFSSILNLTG